MKVKEYKGMYDKINTTAELDGKIIDSVVHMKKHLEDSNWQRLL